mgnify:CR=1 FL=1
MSDDGYYVDIESADSIRPASNTDDDKCSKCCAGMFPVSTTLKTYLFIIWHTFTLSCI